MSDMIDAGPLETWPDGSARASGVVIGFMKTISPGAVHGEPCDPYLDRGGAASASCLVSGAHSEAAVGLNERNPFGDSRGGHSRGGFGRPFSFEDGSKALALLSPFRPFGPIQKLMG